MQGPFEIEVKVRLTNGENTAIVTGSMAVGMVPTKEDLASIIAKASEACKQAGDGYRLQTRPEFENEIIAERTGVTQRFATAEAWDDPVVEG